jgi:hypothetical protein
VNPDFREMLSALSAEGVEFLVVGAYAVAAHGAPRATGDLDIWVRPAPENAQRVLRALRVFGAPIGGLTAGDLVLPGLVFQMGVAPRRIDVLTGIDGVTFEDAYPRRVEIVEGSLRVPVLGRADLLANKRAAGRAKDLADVERLEHPERE